MNQIKIGAAISYLTIFITNLVGLVLTPFIIKSLGDSEYGLFILIGGFISYLSILDLGLTNTIIRFISMYRAKKDKDGEDAFLANTFTIYFILSTITLVIGLILYYQLYSIFGNSLTLLELEKGKKMFLILIFNITLTLPGGALTAICNAHEKFVFTRLLEIIKYTSRSFLIYFVLLYGGDSIALIWVDTFINIIILSITAYYVLKKLEVPLRFCGFMNFKLIKEVLSYSIWISLFVIVYKLQWNAGQTILGIQTDTVTVAIFGIGILLGSYYGAFAGVINTLLLPKATQMTISDADAITYTHAMIKVGRINLLILMLILSGFFLFGKPFIQLWLSSSYLFSWEIALITMIVMTLPLVQGFGNSILEAKSKNKFKAIISFITIGIASFIGFILSKKFGIYGVLLPLIMAHLLNSFIMLYYFKRIFQLKINIFLKNTFLKPILVHSVLVICFFWILSQFSTMLNWNTLFLWIIGYALSYLIITYIFILNSDEKKLLAF